MDPSLTSSAFRLRVSSPCLIVEKSKSWCSFSWQTIVIEANLLLEQSLITMGSLELFEETRIFRKLIRERLKGCSMSRKQSDSQWQSHFWRISYNLSSFYLFSVFLFDLWTSHNENIIMSHSDACKEWSGSYS